MDKSSGCLTSGSSDGAPPSAVESSKNRVNTEQKSADSLPLSRPPSSEVRFISSNSKPVSEQHLGERKLQNRSRGTGNTLVNDAYVPRPASSHSNSTSSRPSSNYSNRSHQTVGPQRGKGNTFLSCKKFAFVIF